MPAIAIVGAGQGLGKSIAQVFGEKGFSVALVARDKNKLEALAAELGAEGIEVAGFAGDITDTDSLSAAFAAIKERFGTVDVLEFSPAPKNVDFTPMSPLDVTIDALAPEIDYYVMSLSDIQSGSGYRIPVPCGATRRRRNRIRRPRRRARTRRLRTRRAWV